MAFYGISIIFFGRRSEVSIRNRMLTFFPFFVLEIEMSSIKINACEKSFHFTITLRGVVSIFIIIKVEFSGVTFNGIII